MEYTVDSLLEKLGCTARNKLWHKIPDEIVVRGTVSHLTWWKDRYKSFCFDLVGTEYSIRACCSRDEAPSEGESIEFKGRISLMTTNNNDASFQVRVNGSPIGTWLKNVNKKEVLTFKDLTKYKGVKLSSLIKKFEEGEKVVLIGSSVGLSDVGSKIECEAIVSFLEVDVTVSNKAEVIHEIKNVLKIDEAIAAIVLVRGGDDKSMEVWDDSDVIKALIEVNIPFFTALGHAHRLTLADKYASDSYPAPVDFSNSLNQEVDHFIYLRSLNKKINILNQKVEEDLEILKMKEKDIGDIRINASENMGKMNTELALLRSKNKGIKYILWGVFSLLLLLVALSGYFFYKITK